MASSLTTQDFNGVPDGMNLALPPQEIRDTEARYLQDILLHKPGLIIRRGPIKKITGTPDVTTKISGFLQTLDPNGNNRLAVLHGDNTNGYFGVYAGDVSAYTDLSFNGALPNTPPTHPYRYVDSKSTITGGVWVGTSSSYNASGPVQNLVMWRGANLADTTTGTVTVSRGSTALVGVGTSWLTTAVPGMFLFANTDDPFTAAYIGIVKTVNSNTSITLGIGSPYAVTAKTFTLTSIRGFAPRVVKGRITCATGSPTVTGANTKFTDQGVGSGTWTLHRASDLAFIGKVTTVNNNTSITLAANAAVAMNNDRYVALRADADFSQSTMAVTDRKVGFLNATYAQRNWYANLGQTFPLTFRVWFSDTSDPEAVDMAPYDGDFIDVASTVGTNSPVKALCAAYNALVVFKENETFGIFGSSPSQFNVKKIEDDGTLSGMSVQPYGGGVIWAGRDGIHFYNGIQSSNITEGKLGDYYKNALRTFDPATYGMWSMVARNHYFLYIENCDPSVAVVKGSTSSTPSSMTICINMVTQAVTILTNLHLRGAVKMPADTGEEVWFAVNSATTGYLCRAADLFDTDGENDAIVADGGTAGPDFYFESKKYNGGVPLRLKLFKQLSAHYLVQGDSLRVDTVLGLNNVGITSSTVFPATVLTWDNAATTFGTWDALGGDLATWDDVINSVFKPKRIKFLKRSQNFAFRVYQNSDDVNRVQMGPFELVYKPMRPGRV